VCECTPRGDSYVPVTGKSVPEHRGVRVGLLAAVAHRAWRSFRAKARGHRETTKRQKADGDRQDGAVDNLHRVRLVGVIAEFVPHESGAG